MQRNIILYLTHQNLNFDIKSSTKGIRFGHIIGPNVKRDIISDASYLPRIVNSVLYNFRLCSNDVNLQLFQSYFTSCYESPLRNKIFHLSNRTHNKLLPLITDCLSLESELICRLSEVSLLFI